MLVMELQCYSLSVDAALCEKGREDVPGVQLKITAWQRYRMEKGAAPYPNTLPGFLVSTYYQPYFPYHRESMHQQTIINHSAVIFLTISKLVGVHLESFVYYFFYSFAGKKCPQVGAWIVIHRELIISEHRFHFSHIFVLFYQIVDCIDGKVCRPTRITNQDIILSATGRCLYLMLCKCM